MASRLGRIRNAGLDETPRLFSFAFCPKMQREPAALFQSKNIELESGFFSELYAKRDVFLTQKAYERKFGFSREKLLLSLLGKCILKAFVYLRLKMSHLTGLLWLKKAQMLLPWLWA